MVNSQLLPYILPFLFLGALCIGSFINVVIYRLPLEKSVVTPRSSCPNCNSLIAWYQNIPVLSFLLLKGKCSNCSCKISVRYPLVEIATALLLLSACIVEPRWIAWPFHWLFLGGIVACVFIDLDHFILPDVITLPGIVVGFTASLLAPHSLIQNGLWIGTFDSMPVLRFFLESITGIIFGGGLLWAVAWAYERYTGKEGLGGGDIKFLAMVGAMLGIKGALMTLVLSSFVGSALGLFLILYRKKSGTTAIPFGPFLSGGAVSAFFFGLPLWEWYFS